jgi:membrane-bound lytic murein transglycosylase D
MYRRDIVPGATAPSPIRLPQTETARFIDMEDSVYNHKSDELLARRTEVEVRDDVPTYYHKSKRYSRGKRGRAWRSSRARRGGSSVTVRRGQTLSEIAKRNGTTVAKLKRLNGIRGSNIRAGKKLRVR